jgi:arginine-tRNA-protein transferase
VPPLDDLTILSPPSRCEYLPDRLWQLRYDLVPGLTRAEYMSRMRDGWRRFGHAVFRPECPSCHMCLSLRVPVDAFRPNQSQRRAWKANVGSITLQVGEPVESPERLELFRRFHAYQHHAKGWPTESGDGLEAFIHNPFPTEEWAYYLDGRLVAVGYVDALPQGLSAIYFYYDPGQRHRSLGTYNVLSILASAKDRGLPHVYLGYWVKGCPSLEYKARFRPHELLRQGRWHAESEPR